MKKKVFMLCLLVFALMASCASAHECSFGSWRIKRQPTCTTPGIKFKYCVSCDHWEQADIRKLPHAVDNWTITREPTCVQEGGKQGMCSTCNSLIRYRIEKIEHAWSETVVVKEPTCTSHGTGEQTCSGCGRKKTVNIDKLGHDMGEIVVKKEATCKAKGSGEQTCSRCGRTAQVSIARLEHEWNEGTVTKEPQGKTKGTREVECLLCGEKRTERFFHEGTLYEDMKPCEEVIRMQEMLRDLDFYRGSIRSGTFGNQTAKAVQRFQEAHDLPGTGVADPATLDKIVSEWERATGKTHVDTLDAEEMENAPEAIPAEEG